MGMVVEGICIWIDLVYFVLGKFNVEGLEVLNVILYFVFFGRIV